MKNTSKFKNKRTNNILNDFITFYNENMPDKVYLVKNHGRYENAFKAANTICELVKQYDKDVEVTLYQDELVGTALCLEIKTDLFVIDNMGKFVQSLQYTDTFEASSLKNGKICIGITFEDVWKPFEPKDNDNK